MFKFAGDLWRHPLWTAKSLKMIPLLLCTAWRHKIPSHLPQSPPFCIYYIQIRCWSIPIIIIIIIINITIIIIIIIVGVIGLLGLQLNFATQTIEKDCPDNATDAILWIMFSGRHISVNWKILSKFLSVLICHFSHQQILIGGRGFELIPIKELCMTT